VKKGAVSHKAKLFSPKAWTKSRTLQGLNSHHFTRR
jgi:hypothetical protein